MNPGCSIYQSYASYVKRVCAMSVVIFARRLWAKITFSDDISMQIFLKIVWDKLNYQYAFSDDYLFSLFSEYRITIVGLRSWIHRNHKVHKSI